MSRSCLGLVSVLSRCGFGDVSVMSRSCLCLCLVMSRCCFGDKLIDIDKHFDRDSTQNLKFQFEFVYCAPLGKPV